MGNPVCAPKSPSRRATWAGRDCVRWRVKKESRVVKINWNTSRLVIWQILVWENESPEHWQCKRALHSRRGRFPVVSNEAGESQLLSKRQNQFVLENFQAAATERRPQVPPSGGVCCARLPAADRVQKHHQRNSDMGWDTEPMDNFHNFPVAVHTRQLPVRGWISGSDHQLRLHLFIHERLCRRDTRSQSWSSHSPHHNQKHAEKTSNSSVSDQSVRIQLTRLMLIADD